MATSAPWITAGSDTSRTHLLGRSNDALELLGAKAGMAERHGAAIGGDGQPALGSDVALAHESTTAIALGAEAEGLRVARMISKENGS